MITPSGVPTTMDQYDVSIAIPAAPGQPPFVLSMIPVIEGRNFLALQGFHALIGRDILSKCVLTYNGSEGFYTLAY